MTFAEIQERAARLGGEVSEDDWSDGYWVIFFEPGEDTTSDCVCYPTLTEVADRLKSVAAERGLEWEDG